MKNNGIIGKSPEKMSLQTNNVLKSMVLKKWYLVSFFPNIQPLCNDVCAKRFGSIVCVAALLFHCLRTCVGFHGAMCKLKWKPIGCNFAFHLRTTIAHHNCAPQLRTTMFPELCFISKAQLCQIYFWFPICIFQYVFG